MFIWIANKSLAPNGASMRPNTSCLNYLVKTFKGSEILVYSIPEGLISYEVVCGRADLSRNSTSG